MWVDIDQFYSGYLQFNWHNRFFTANKRIWKQVFYFSSLYLLRIYFINFSIIKIISWTFKNKFSLDSFVYIASKSVDEEGTILTSTVAGTSQTQCLAFHYYISGTNSNITLSWNSSSSDAFWEITNPEFNSFVCVALNISTLEEDKVMTGKIRPGFFF